MWSSPGWARPHPSAGTSRRPGRRSLLRSVRRTGPDRGLGRPAAGPHRRPSRGRAVRGAAQVQARRLDRSGQFAVIAAHEAWADAGFEELAPDNGIDPDRLGVVCASGIGGVTTLLSNYDELLASGPRRVRRSRSRCSCRTARPLMSVWRWAHRLECTHRSAPVPRGPRGWRTAWT